MPENARNARSSFILWMQFQLNRIFAAFSGRFNASLSAFRTSSFHLIRIRLIASFNRAIFCLILILIGFLQLKKTDPFSTHPKTMCLAVSTALVFFVAYVALPQLPLRRRFAIIGDRCLFQVGITSVASITSVLLPDSLRPFVFAVFGLLPATEFLCWLYQELVADDHDFWRVRVLEFFRNIVPQQQQQTLPL